MPTPDAGAVVALLNHLDTVLSLTTRLGTPPVREAAETDEPEYPSVEYTVISTPLGENLQDVLVQFDFWELDAEAGELRGLLFDVFYPDGPHREPLARLYDGVWLVVRYVDGRRLPDPEAGRKHWSDDYRITVNR